MRLIPFGLAVVMLSALAPAAVAQSPVTEVTPLGPRAAEVRAGIDPRPARTDPLTADPRAPAVQGTRRQNAQLLTIVGGALFLAGVLIDDDAGTVVALVGLGIGVYGLVQWLQTTISAP